MKWICAPMAKVIYRVQPNRIRSLHCFDKKTTRFIWLWSIFWLWSLINALLLTILCYACIYVEAYDKKCAAHAALPRALYNVQPNRIHSLHCFCKKTTRFIRLWSIFSLCSLINALLLTILCYVCIYAVVYDKKCAAHAALPSPIQCTTK